MKKLLSQFSIAMLAVAMVMSSCGQHKQAEAEQEVPLKVTYSIDCSKDLLDLCDVVVTYHGDDGVHAVDTITADPSPDNPSGVQTWSRTVGTHEIPVKIGFDYTLVQKTDTLLIDGKNARLTIKGSIIAEKIGIRKRVAHLSTEVISSNTSFFVDPTIMDEEVINTRRDLATIIDVYNERQAHSRETDVSNTCFIVKPHPYGKGLKVEKACWNDAVNK